jgi:hypothetical protein
MGMIRRSLEALVALLLSAAATLVGLAALLVAALPLIAQAVPLEMDRVVMSDGRRQVEMQGMAHVAAADFYDQVRELVARRRAEGWLVYYEQVRNDVPDPARGMAEVLDRLGASWDPGEAGGQHPYELMAPLLGENLVLQDNGALIGPPGPEVRNVDVSLSQLLRALPPAAEAREETGEPVDLAAMRRSFDESPDWVKRRFRAASRIMLSMATSGEFARRMLPAALTDLREEVVVEAIRAEPGRNVLILYGQAHMDAIRERLEATDPAWSVVSEEGVPIL